MLACSYSFLTPSVIPFQLFEYLRAVAFHIYVRVEISSNKCILLKIVRVVCEMFVHFMNFPCMYVVNVSCIVTAYKTFIVYFNFVFLLYVFMYLEDFYGENGTFFSPLPLFLLPKRCRNVLYWVQWYSNFS